MAYIIAVSGKKQSGKDTLTEHIEHVCKGCGLQTRKYAFADPMKEFFIYTNMLSYEQCYGSEEDKQSLTSYKWDSLPDFISNGKTGYMTARELMQVFGTEIMRQMFSDQIWVDAILARIEKEDNCDIAIIPDIRFSSELFAIYDKNGAIIRLTRTASDHDPHASEVSLDNWDWHSSPCNEHNTLLVPDNLDAIGTRRYVEPFVKRYLQFCGMSVSS